MRWWCLVLLFALPAAAGAQNVAVPVIDEALLGFEREPSNGMPGGWDGGPKGTLISDDSEKHGGARSLRLERTATSRGPASSVTLDVPVDFAVGQVELRGWLRQEGSGAVSLWMRQDGANGPLGFVDMSRAPAVSSEWSERSVQLRLQPAARTLILGVRIAGVGRGWADDLQ